MKTSDTNVTPTVHLDNLSGGTVSMTMAYLSKLFNEFPPHEEYVEATEIHDRIDFPIKAMQNYWGVEFEQ